ncbi:MAG: lamin tail domain-containing protein [Verrucomicrobia bacterium]|nr:lamin tail domain-containing protein [Verrucomicrobiota bacterium]
MIEVNTPRAGLSKEAAGLLPAATAPSPGLVTGRALCLLALLLCLAPAALAAVRISEFLTGNDGLLHDSDGDSPDWIELQNDAPTAVNLAGWHLTDEATNLTKWTFPATNLPPGGYVLVFASGKDRAVVGAELHANFQLEQSGEYLALVAPDGTVVSAFAPRFPPQRANVSFGFGSSNAPPATLLASGAAARWLVPTNSALGDAWLARDFDVSTWNAAATPLRYDVTVAGAPVLSLDFNARSANTPANTQTGFTSFTMSAASGIQTTPTTRSFGALTVTLSNSAAGIGYDDRFRTTPVNSGAFTLEDLFLDFVFSRELTGTSGLDLFIAGLAPGQLYGATLWSFDSSSPSPRISDWFANGALVTNNYTFNGATLPANDAAYRFSFQAAATPSGGLLISGRRDTASLANSPAVFLNALQLTPVTSATTTNGNLAAMAGQNTSVFVRQAFTVANPTAFNQLTLRLKYDDGFVAYLNGVEVARRNAPETLAWDSTAPAPHLVTDFEDVPLPGAPAALVAGTNILAIQGLNAAAGDATFLLEPQLVATFSTELSERYFRPPTPGAPNNAGYLGLVADTKFDHDRGFYDAPFSLSITCATAGATIYFTTNGGPPSPTNGFLFTAPISIRGQSFIRAAAFLPGYVPSDIDTHSYLFLRDVLRQSNNIPGYPTSWQASYPGDYAMDSNIVNHPVYGATLSNDLRSLPSLCIVSDHSGLWNSSTGIYPNPTSIGVAWERATALELIRGDGKTEFATTCKIQIHGNASRDNNRTPKHAFGVAFNSDYGPAKLHYDWFGGGVDVHDNLVLRQCGFVDGWPGRYADEGIYTSAETGETFRGLRYRPENTCYLRDAWVKDSFRAMGWTSSRSQYVHLYLNGLYWGLYEPSERLDASYFSLHLGGQEGAWDVVVGEDNNGPPVLVDGSLADWQNVLNLVNAGITNEAAYQAVAERVDLDNLIDYMILHVFAESEDWPRHNWYVAHRRATNGVPGTKFICSVWDQELTLDRLVRRNRLEVGGAAGEIYSPARVYQQLRTNAEFRVRFGDRVHKHLFNGGALTPSNNVARLLGPAAIIHDALVGESARWGDARKFPTPGGPNGTGKTFTRDEWWQPEIDKLATNFFQKLTADNVARFQAGNLYPALGAPEFNQFGGAVSNGFALTLSHPNPTGTIFCTLDGSDPRAYGTGLVAPTAQAYDQPITLNAPTVVRGRVLAGTNWSALVEALFYPPQDLTALALTEIMFNPRAVGATNGDEFEFLELKNTGTNALDLSVLTFAAGLSFTFPNGTVLAPGQFFVLARNTNAFAAKYPGVAVHGVYGGRLDNGGERLTLSYPFGGNVFSVAYDDAAPWPVTPDNYGFSLVPKSGVAAQAPDDGAKWRASTNPGGSPGADDPAPIIAPVVLNEVLSASVPPAVDTIELFNPTASNVDLGGWFLTDDPNAPMKFRIPAGTIIPADGFVVFDETQFNATPGTNSSFALSSSGDDVYLFSGDATTNLTGYSHGFGFGAAAAGVSFGRYVNSVGEEQFPAQLSQTFSNANSGPRVGPVVINEIHYHPDAGGDEFVELRNVSAGLVPLFDPTNPTNVWKLAGLAYTLPSGITLAPGGLLLLVATNPADFQAKYSVPTNVPVLGPFAGALQDSGERLKLERPDAPTTNGVPYIAVDEVRYNDKAPWPSAADGGGASLQRRDAAAYGDDPTNWLAAPPTPGRDPAIPDTDGDGIPDEWMMRHFGHATGQASDNSLASGDPDRDGLNNGQEFVAGTDPLDPASVLRVEAISPADGGHGAVLRFFAVSNVSYTVQFQETLQAGPWQKLTDVTAASTSRWIAVTNALPETDTRFYRLVTPGQP